MNKRKLRRYSKTIVSGAVVLGMLSFGFGLSGVDGSRLPESPNNDDLALEHPVSEANVAEKNAGAEFSGRMPLYGNWTSFSKKDGLPSDKAYCVKIDGSRVLVGTHDGLAVYESGSWKTYTKEDGLAHNGVLAIDINRVTGDVWLATMGGLTRWSAGNFENFTQMNSGMPNDLIYGLACDGKDVWVATGGGAGKYDTFTGNWEIFTEKNAPMHEPWTYGICSGEGKIFIAAWGGGVIEYTKDTKKFRDYTDPDGNMEIDLFPDDGLVHDITTGTSWSDGYLWVATYFGLSRYDGVHWKGYFDHDSGLASNFINFIKAFGPVAYICTDKGLSTTDGESWVTYANNGSSSKGKAFVTENGTKRELSNSPSLSHNYILGVDVSENFIWVATSSGVSRGELIRKESAATLGTD